MGKRTPRRARLPRKAAVAGSITALWYEIEDLSGQAGNDVEQIFEGGATEDDLVELERDLGYALPSDLRELFSICASADYLWPNGDRDLQGIGMAGMLEDIGVMRECLTPMPKLQLFPGTRAPLVGTNLIPLERGDPCLCYDLKPGKGGKVGQIVDLDMESGTLRVVAPSLQAFLEQGIGSLKNEIEQEKR